MHYRSRSSARFREERVMDPLLVASLDRPDLEDEAETVSWCMKLCCVKCQSSDVLYLL